LDAIFDGTAGVLKKALSATTACNLLGGVGERGVASLQIANIAAFVRILIEHDNTRNSAGANPDIGIRPNAPPALNDGGVYTGVMQTMLRPGVFPDIGTGGVATGAAFGCRAMTREHIPTLSGVEECRL
jgi:hypothetical protein